MTATRKRRWSLAIVSTITLLLVVFVGIVLLLPVDDPKDDAPRLVVVELDVNTPREYQGVRKGVRFRFDAPEHMFARLEWPSWQNLSTGEERSVGAVSVDTLWDVNAGQSREFTLLLPSDVGEVWRLRCQVRVDTTGVKGVLTRVRLCWQNKSFTPLRWTVYRHLCFLESEPTTNAIPPTTETPSRWM